MSGCGGSGTSGQADLFDAGESWSDFSPTTITAIGQSFSASCDVRNGGVADSGSFVVKFYASLDAAIAPSDHFIGQVYLAGISAGGSADCDLAVPFPSGVPTGTYWVGWIIDADGTVSEANEGDNIAYKAAYQLNVSPPLYDWTRRMGASSSDVGYGVCADGNGNVYVTGHFTGTVDFAADWGTSDTKTAPGLGDVFVTKVHVDGSYGWTKRMGGSSLARAHAICTDGSGNVYVTGYFRGTADFGADWGESDPKTSAGGSDDDDIFVTKIGADGSYGWTRRMGGPDYDTGYGICADY